MAVKYADFSSEHARGRHPGSRRRRGIPGRQVTSTDTRRGGQQVQSGTVDIDGFTYTWRVSAALSDKYDIKGLPDTAAYVGIRLTA